MSKSENGFDARIGDMTSGPDLTSETTPAVGIAAPSTTDTTTGSESLLGTDLATDIGHVTIVAGCGCAICQGLRDAGDDGAGPKVGVNDANPEGMNIGTLLPLVTNSDGSRSITGDRNVDAILIGSKWGTQNLTYSFPTSGSNYNGSGYDTNGVSLYHLTAGTQQQAAARAAFAQIQAWTGMTFTEIADSDTVHANIRISQTADADAGSAYGNFPSDTRGLAGDIWFGRTSQPYYDLAFKGTWGYSTMFHEIGHTMGLKHGHQDYTNSDLSFYFGSFPRFGTQALTPDRDGQAWSLMTYTPAPGTSGFAGDKANQPQSYMQYDLAALQYMYGANYTTNAGDTVYSWNSTGEMFINGVGQGAPSGNKILLTIWDGGGNDTIDASNYANGVSIDLRPGQFSTLDSAQLANHVASQNLTALAPGNIAMSLLYNNDTRSLIENATGGAGNDLFVGNTANNVLDGGAGSDAVQFTNTTGVTVALNDTGADVIVSHDGETDTLRSIENIGGTSGNDTIAGNSQNNTLTGGSGGQDVLSGGAGDDRLIGGGFSVTNTTIITKAQAEANLTTATAIDPQARNAYTLVSDANITSSTTVPHATINATSTGGGLEYYRIDAAAGSTGIFDIDFSGVDTWIELVNGAGVVLANNDDNATDLGSSAGNSYLTYTFATAGTYYLRVGRWTAPADTVAQPLAEGTTYTLHMSLSTAVVNTAPFVAVNTSSAVLDGGVGNDFLQGTVGNDVLSGGDGSDTASFVTAFSNTATGVTVDLRTQGVAQNTGAAGSDTLTGIENLVGSQYNDTLTGDAGNNVIEGGLGNDTLVGGVGVDTASYAGAAAGVTVSLGLQGTAQNTGNAGTDTLSGFENLQGSAFDDTLTGDAAANTISGGAGDDVLNPGANGAGARDLLDGGAGSDTASFAGLGTVFAVLNGAADGTAIIGGTTVASLRNIENLLGSANADFLSGDANANVIDGGLGDDQIDGGAGIDTLSFASAGTTGITVNLATTTAQVTGVGTKTITNFENVRTTAGTDNVTGDANDNVFFDRGGADIYNGAAGSDTIDYSAATSAVTVNLGTTTAQNVGTFGGSDTITNIENVVGAANFANTLTGNTLANRLTGGAAADTIQGNAGNDVIIGGAGNDILLGGTSAALDDGSSDTLEGGAGSDYLSGGQGNDILRGGDGDDSLIGGVGNTARQYFVGVDGGDDTFDGGDGTDTAIMVYDGRLGVGASTVGVAFDLKSLAGNSTITFNGVNVGSLTSIETLIFRGTTVNDTVGGTGAADNLFGGAGDDILDGWYGNDLLEGGAGNDTLIGGEGLDMATYAGATAGVNVDLRIVGVAQDTGGAGIDTLSEIEYLTGSAFGDTLRGTDSFNLILDTGVGAGATALSQTDSLFGYGGNDTMQVTRAAAAVATRINMDGGTGDDFIELRGGALSATPAAIPAGLSATPGGAAPTYMALGTTSNDRNSDVVTIDGGAGNDRIILSGVASGTIDAGAGDDIVSISMRGVTTVNNYLLTLGTGADIIQFGVGASVASSTDVAVTARTNRVTDFERGDAGDKFEMTNFLNLGLSGYTANSNPFASNYLRLTQSGTDLLLQVDRDGAGAGNAFVTIFAITNGYTGGFTAYNFDGFIGALVLTGTAADETLTGATGTDTLSGGDGNDVLIGLAGNDTLDGGTGNDILRGGAGDDVLIGGADNDTASYSDATAGVTVNLGIAAAQATGAGNDTLVGIENLEGSAFDDALTGDATVNVLAGGAGNDLLDGGAGADTLAGGSGNDVFIVDNAGDVVIEQANEGTDAVRTSINYTLSANVENLILTGGALNGTGNELGNVIKGNDAANVLFGLAGDDRIAGGGGNDTLDGGDGIDTLDYANVTTAVQINLATGTVNAGAQGGVDTVANFENAVLGSGNDQFIGTAGDNVVEGGAGNDTIDGDAGNDTAVYRGIVAQDGMAIQAFDQLRINAGAQGIDTLTNMERVRFINGETVLDVAVVNGNAVVASVADTGGVAQVGTLTRTAAQGVLANDINLDQGAGDQKIVGAVRFGETVGTVGQPLVGANGTLTLNADGSYTYVANAGTRALPAGATATDAFTYTADDGDAGDSTPTTLTITITGANDVPVITGTTTGGVIEDAAATLTTTGTLVATDADTGQSGFTPNAGVIGTSGLGSFTLTAGGVWTYTANNNQAVIQRLGAGDTVTDSFTAVSADGSASQVVIVTITGVNDAVTLSGGVLATYIDTAANDDFANVGGQIANVPQSATLIGTLSDADNGDVYTYRLVGTPDTAYGTLTLASNGSYVFTPNDAAINALKGLASVSYVIEVSDGASTSQAEFTVRMSGINDTATITGVLTGAVTEDASVSPNGDLTTSGKATINDVDIGDAAARTTDGEVAAQYGFYTIAADGSWTYRVSNASVQYLGVGQTLTDSFIIGSIDGTASTPITVMITGTNDRPVLTGGSLGIYQDTAVTDDFQTISGQIDPSPAQMPGAGVVGNLTDVDQTGTYTFVRAGSDTENATNDAYGTLTVNSNGSYTFVPNDAAINALTTAVTLVYTIRVKDGSGTDTATSFASFTLTLNGVNDSAVIAGNLTPSVTEDVGVVGGNLVATGMLTISDADAGQNSFVPATRAGTYGTLVLRADGTYTYTASNTQRSVQEIGQGSTRLDTFTVTASDGTAQTVTVTINGANDAPIVQMGNYAQTVAETNAAINLSGQVVAVDDVGDTQTYSVGSSVVESTGVTLTEAQRAELAAGFTLSSTTGSYSYQVASPDYLDPGQSVTVAYNVVVTDQLGAQTKQPVSFTITGTIDAGPMGSPTDDTLTGTAIGEMISGGAGDDRISGLGGNDQLSGDAGDDTLDGGSGNDTLSGGTGNDRLDGGSGDDTLSGGTGTNIIDGGSGTDTGVLEGVFANYTITQTGPTSVQFVRTDGQEIVTFSNVERYRFSDGAVVTLGNNASTGFGGAGADVLTGNGGNDVFDYPTVAGSAATVQEITDFTLGDLVNLSRIDADTLATGDNAFSFIGSAAFSGSAGELRAFEQNGQWFVQGDIDGNGAADLSIQLTTDHALTTTDFIL